MSHNQLPPPTKVQYAPSIPEYAKDLLSYDNPHESYQLIRKIGSGTYGDVYESKMVKNPSVYAAVKVIKVDFEKEDFEVVLQEIDVMKNCTHANIVAFYKSYLRKNKLWICMEYCGGGSLQDIYHATGKPIDERGIQYSMRETLRGIFYMHTNRKIHRDIKGANILVTLQGNIKLADFGIAAKLTDTLNKRKSFIGTPYWMAPEVASVEKKGAYGEACDIWSIGITAIELAELQPPMFDLHPMTALVNMTKRNYSPPKLEKDSKHWSSGFHSFLKKLFVINPRQRPTADEMLRHPFVNQASLGVKQGQDMLKSAKSANKGKTGLIIQSEEDEDEEDFCEVNRGFTAKEIQSASGDRMNGDLMEEVESGLKLGGIELGGNNSGGNNRPNNNAPTVIPANRHKPSQNSDTVKNRQSDQIRTNNNITNQNGNDQNNQTHSNNQDSSNHTSQYSQNTQYAPSSSTQNSPNLSNPNSSSFVPASRPTMREKLPSDGRPPARPDTLPKNLTDQITQSNRKTSGVPMIPQTKRMEAGLSQIFKSCPLSIHCAVTWNKKEGGILNTSGDSTLMNEKSMNESMKSRNSMDRSNHSDSETDNTSTLQATYNNNQSSSTATFSAQPTTKNSTSVNNLANSDKLNSQIRTDSSSNLQSPVNPQSFVPNAHKDYLLFGSDNGIFSLDKTYYYNIFEDAKMHQIHHRPCYWIDIHENTMMTISGKSETPWLYVHDILALHEAMVNNQLPTAGGGNELPQQEGSTLQKLRDKCSKRIDDKLFPTNYKFHSRRVPNTKGCRACAVRTNHYADDKTRYLVAALEKQILLMEWYEPMNRFKEVKRVDYRSPRLSSAGIRLVINKNQQYPTVILNVWKERQEPTINIEQNITKEKRYYLNSIDLNTEIQHCPIPEGIEPLNVCAGAWFIQFEPTTFLLTFDNHVKVINNIGQLKVETALIKSELEFKFPIETIVSSRNSVLAFGQHVIEGKSFAGQRTQYMEYKDMDLKLLTQQTGQFSQDLVVSMKKKGDPYAQCDLSLLLGDI